MKIPHLRFISEEIMRYLTHYVIACTRAFRFFINCSCPAFKIAKWLSATFRYTTNQKRRLKSLYEVRFFGRLFLKFFFALFPIFLKRKGQLSYCLCRYFSLVARPPRVWRSDLLTSKILRASEAKDGLKVISRSVTSLCTVGTIWNDFT